MKKKRKFRIGLTMKIFIAIIVISLAATILVSVTNYYKYLDAVYDVHSEYAEKIAQTIEDSLVTEEWETLSEAVDAYQQGDMPEEELLDLVSTGDYGEAMNGIQALVDSMNLQRAAIFKYDREALDAVTEDNFDPDNAPMVSYLMDFNPTDSGLSAIEPGYTYTWWTEYEIFDDYRDIFDEVEDSQTATAIREFLDGGNQYLTVYHPIMDGDKVVAIVQVSSDAISISSFVNSFFQSTLWKGILQTLILIGGAIAYFFFSMIRPLRTLRKEADEFVQNNAEVSDRLDKIHTRDEIEDLAQSFLKMEQDVQEYVNKVAEVTETNARISTEMGVATKIQVGMLPTIFPPFPDRKDFNIYATMDPAKEVGGDFYDFFFTDEDHFVLVIADVAGKGVPAALFMAIAKSLIKNRAQMGGTPAEVLTDVNHQLCESNEAGMFVTVWMAIIDLATGEGVAANAGHEHPVRASEEEGYELVCYRHSLALAAFDGVPFRQHSFKLEPGDRIFVYTDGLPEAINSSEEAYGTERFMKILNENESASPEELLHMIAEDVERFKGDEPQFDDLTMLMFEYKGR